MTKIAVFKGQKIRRHWDENNEKWWFSVVDVVAILSASIDARNYWKVLKNRLKKEGSEVVTKCNQLKMQASDGKYYLTDVADTETMFRIIQSIPSPNAEPFKLWLARVGYERIEESEDPEKAIQRAMHFYLKRGYSKDWVNQRLKSIEIRKELTDEWENRGVIESSEFAILTDEITFAWAGMKTREYKKYKRLRKENLRDNMTNLELVLNMLAEVSTTEISKKVEPKSFVENKKVAREGGSIAGAARRKLEKRTGKKVVTKLNTRGLKLVKSANHK
ncbi:antirepressor [Candidatus Gottesmanbacteria bacterium RIFCSPLOWO2_01_FULL_39_12b]|uniref:Antirepressor n=1 Tax=Candidatus Gottesmanbacteria bacterium RIFCSPLOWO2_01_FULL_39_12b TaxID=1798388 RepID=A0A1F6APW5_9BACT|nr:MAG: antirepressor [Candidatus Gottesmanbacteria bacterium RIFCSPLOWO2_01_FULL_39_12b]